MILNSGKGSLFLWALLLLLPLLFFVWLFGPVSDDATARPTIHIEEVTTRVSVAAAERVSLPIFAETTGTLAPWRRVEAKVETGGRIVKRWVDEGQQVAAGTPLLSLFDEDARIELAEAEADLLQIRARYAVFIDIEQGAQERRDTDEACINASTSDCAGAGLKQAEEEVLEAQDLFDQGLISEEVLRRIRRRYNTTLMLGGEHREDVQAATTGLTQAELRVQRAQSALDRTVLRAAFAGRVADVQVEIGQQLSRGETCLQILDDSRMTVDVDVLEADIVHLRPGAPAQIRVPALGQKWLSGVVESINPQVDPATGSGRARVLIDNPDGLLMPGLFTFVRLQIQVLDDRLVIPEQAVILRQGRELVFRIEEDRALWAYVDTGSRSGDRVEIRSGLSDSELVAVSGHFALAHESRVSIVDSQVIETGSPQGTAIPWNTGSAP